MDSLEIEITDRVVSELKKRKIKQIELITLCNKIGMPISQPDISKIYSGKKTLSLYQFATICRVLEMPMDFFLWGEDRSRDDFCNPHDSLNLHDSGKALKCYIGNYFFYYLSTAYGEDKILKGILDIIEEKGFYRSHLELDTGERDLQGMRIRKIYEGRILVSTALGAAYIIFKNEVIGELCMICLRHRVYNVKVMECRVGLALTMSAGETKEPTAHRCLIVREKLDNDQLQGLRPWLKLIDDNICIEEESLEKILKESKEKYPDYANQLDRSCNLANPRKMIDLSAEMLRRQLSLERDEFAGFLTKLYERADVPKNYKVSLSDDARFYERVGVMKDEAVNMDVEGNRLSG